jgi:hypothetical protein
MANHSTISRSSVKARKAGARDVGNCMVHSPRRRWRQPGEASRAVLYLSGALGLAIVEWQLEAANRRLNTIRGWG